MEHLAVLPPLVQVSRTADGTVTYLVGTAPDALPPVLGKDLARAWDQARHAAQASRQGTTRLFRFRRADGGWTDLALLDRDARCWAAALDGTLDLRTGYGLSVCLRLLALVGLLAQPDWPPHLIRWDRGDAILHPALLRAAAHATLTETGGLDESQLRAALAALPAT